MSTNTESNEWKTVTRGRYVPPSKRGEMEKLAAEEEKKKPLDFQSDKAFPTLGGVKTEVSGTWGKKKFTETIQDLIALEQRTTEEREAAEEETRKNEGTTILKLPKTDDEKRAISERFYEWAVKESEYLEAVELGCHAGQVVEGMITSRYIEEYTDGDDGFGEYVPAEDEYTIGTGRQVSSQYVVAGSSQKSTQKGSHARLMNLLQRKKANLRARAAAEATAVMAH